MLKNWTGLALGLAVASISWATAPAHPGTLNYIEGQASVDGRVVTAQSAGTASVEPGSVLTTGAGHAEMLLTPGVFLRVGENSAVKMVSPGLTDTRVEVLKGTAMVEANTLQKENHVQILDERASVVLLKNGLYEVNGDRDTVAVYDGKATVSQDDKQVDVKSGHEVDLNGPLKSQKFDKKDSEKTDPLYQWTKVRSDYVNGASAALVTSGWAGGGWGWDPYYSSWAFAPVGGMFYSPFWGGFYSPWDYGYLGGGYGYGYGYGSYAPPVIIGRGGVRGPVRSGGVVRGQSLGGRSVGGRSAAPSFSGRSFGGGGGFHGSAAGGGGGGFHGGGGGFHGGGGHR